MTKLAATQQLLKRRVQDARARLSFDKIDGAPPAAGNVDDTRMADPSNVARVSLNYEGVGNGHGPTIGGDKSA